MESIQDRPCKCSRLDCLKSELEHYWRHIDLVHVLVLVISPVFLCLATQYIHFQRQTALWTLFLFPVGNLAITAGYHRLWAHKTYHASLPLRYFLAIVGAGMFQWSILWWCTHHRSHHRYTDTNRDPYNARRGFFYSHMGWLLFPTPEKWGAVDVSDLKKDTVVVWQDKYYVPLAGMVSMLFPSMVAHVGWNDWQGGLLYAGAIRVYLGLHFTFLVNSLAHWMGDQPYGDKFTPRQNLLVAIITCGEGYHNFHHVFPSDYRNGVHWYDLDPTKWFIWSCEQLRLASQLSRIPDREIEYARNLMLRMSCAGPDTYTIPLDSPTMTWEEFERQAKAGRCLVCIAGFVYDLIDFMHDHPGGPKLIQQVVGKEATSVFYEEFHHSPHATNLLASMRIATIHIGRSRNKTYRMTNT